MDKILALLQAAVLGLLAVLGNHHATVPQQQSAIDFSIKAVQTAKNVLQASSSVVQPSQQLPKVAQTPPNPCHTDLVYGRIDCSAKTTNVSPLVYLDAVLTKNGVNYHIAGVNRADALNQLGLQSPIDDLNAKVNPYKVSGFYAPSSFSAGDKLSVSIHLNPNRRDNTICQKSWDNVGAVNATGAWAPQWAKISDETDQIALSQKDIDTINFNLQYSNHSEMSYAVHCKSDTGQIHQLTPYDSEHVIEQNFDSLTIDYVK